MTAGSGKTSLGLTIALFTVIAGLNYLPVFTGKIPFPQDLVLRHPAWEQPTKSSTPKPSPEIGDLITSFYPFHSLLGRASEQRTFPLWNPHILGGTPLLANSQAAPFYPFNSLYYFLPLNLAWTICMILRFFLAGLFMALLVRSIGGSTTGSILSGIIFSLCGFMTAWQGTGMGDGAIWLPMICLAVRRLHRNPSAASIALAGFSFAMPVLAGHPETAAHLTLVGCALALWLAFQRLETVDTRFIAYFAMSGVLAVGLAAVQIVPTVEWLGQIGSIVSRIPPTLSRHDGQGFFSRDLQSSPSSALLRIPEAASYLGMFGIMAVPLALFHRSRRDAAFFGVIAIAAAAVAFSIEPAHWIASHLPFFKGLKNGRLILVASFGIAGLAGMGISALEQNVEPLLRGKRKLALILLLGMFLVCLVGIFEVHRATFVPVSFLQGPWGALAFLLPAAALLTWRIVSDQRGRIFSILACGLAGMELLSFSFGYTGFTKPVDVYPPAPLFEFLHSRGDPSTFRIAKSGYPIPANSAIVYGLESADGYEIPTERAKTFSAGLTEERDDAVFYDAKQIVQSQDRRMDMLNVKYWTVIAGSPEFAEFSKRPEKFVEIYNKGSIAVFENMSVLPRLLAAPQTGIQIVPDAEVQMRRIKDPAFNPEQTVFLSKWPAPMSVEKPGIPAFSSNIQLTRSDMNSYSFRARTSDESVLVFSQIFYPGWKATIDGTEVPVFPVDYALTGILAPQGEHLIHFYFQPHSFRVGAVLSLISLGVLAMLVISGGVWEESAESDRIT